MTALTILIADDEAMILRVLRLRLESAGYEVMTAPNGQVALEIIRETPPDILVTDIEMPMMTGEQLCNALLAEMPDRKFPIFVATSLTDLHHREWSKPIGNLHFLEKPLSVKRLTAALNELGLSPDQNKSEQEKLEQTEPTA